MTLRIHTLVDELSDDSPLLPGVEEALRINRALAEAMADVHQGRTFAAHQFMTKVQERWPQKSYLYPQSVE